MKKNKLIRCPKCGSNNYMLKKEEVDNRIEICYLCKDCGESW